MQRSEAGRALRIQIRLVCDQQLCHLAIVAPCRKVQRHFTVPVSLVKVQRHVTVPVSQVGAFDVSALAQHPRQPIAPAFAVASQLCIDGRAVVEEVSCQREVAQNHCMVKIRPAVFVRLMRGKLASQELGELSSPFGRGQCALSAFHPSRHVLSKRLTPSLAQPPLPKRSKPVPSIGQARHDINRRRWSPSIHAPAPHLARCATRVRAPGSPSRRRHELVALDPQFQPPVTLLPVSRERGRIAASRSPTPALRAVSGRFVRLAGPCPLHTAASMIVMLPIARSPRPVRTME